MHKAHLAGNARQVADDGALALPERPHDLEALDRGVGGSQRLEPERGPDQALELAMIRLDDVVEVAHLAVLGGLRQEPLLLQRRAGRTVAPCLVGVDHCGPLLAPQTPQRLGEEAFGSLRVTGGREVELDGDPVLVYGAVKVRPAALHTHVGLIHPPAGRARPAPLPPQAALDLGRVALRPSVDRGVVHTHPALFEHLLELAVAHPVLAVPPNRPQDDGALKVPPLEVVHRPVLATSLGVRSPTRPADATEPRAIEVTGSRVGDAPMLPQLLDQIPIEERISTVTADGAYDTRTSHAAIAARQACAVIPVRRNGRRWKETTPGAQARNEILLASRRFGRPISKNWSGYHQRSRIEAKMRCLELLGERLMARTFDRQTAELQIRAAVLNRFTQLGTPQTRRVA